MKLRISELFLCSIGIENLSFFSISEAQEVVHEDVNMRLFSGLVCLFIFLKSCEAQGLSLSLSIILFYFFLILFSTKKPVVTLGLIAQRSLTSFVRDFFLFSCDVFDSDYSLLLRYA